MLAPIFLFCEDSRRINRNTTLYIDLLASQQFHPVLEVLVPTDLVGILAKYIRYPTRELTHPDVNKFKDEQLRRVFL